MYKATDNIPEAAKMCAGILQKKGSVILVPTETVYGLAANFDDRTAIEEIYRLKGRDRDKPLALFVRKTSDIVMAGGILDKRGEALISRFMPGPLTLILPGRNGSSVGIRMPSHPFIMDLLKHLPFPLVNTSANASGYPNALSCTEALAMLNGEPAAAIDGGALPPTALASTIVDLRHPDTFSILRKGPISEADISEVLGKE